MPALPRRAERHGDHFIVCGDGPLAYRITQELTSRYDERVTVLLPSRQRNYGPQIGALSRVRVLEHPEIRAQFATQSIDAAGGGPEQFGELIRSDTAKWARVVETARIKAD